MEIQENKKIISCGHYHTAALTSEGKIIYWGNNTDLQLNIPKGLISSTDIYKTIQLW
jgi:alpha-tubulin suppressor-like RCC1 family protein